MNPVFEQGNGQGIGYSYRHFLNHFLQICNEHLKSRRAENFAFILYDFHDKHIREILKKQGVFTQLDRLSGKDLTIFYINSEEKQLIKSFNKIFLGAFEVKEEYKKPLVLFFKINNDEVEDVEIVELEQTELIYAFKELYDHIENYINIAKENKESEKPKTNKLIAVFNTVKKVTLEKVIELLIQGGAEKLNHM